MNQQDPTSNTPQHYWSRTRRLTLALLLIWFISTFCIIFFARELSEFSFFGWPLSYYLVAQGMIILYTTIIAVYAFKMDKIDKYVEAHDEIH